jgi:large subunit ribosomal protein L15
MRRLPKFGFSNVDYANRFEIVNLSQLGDVGSVVTPETLQAKGLLRPGARVKILAKGEIKGALTVKAHKFSAAAQAAIEKAGGRVEVIA